MVELRKATLRDIPNMQEMVAKKVQEGVILPRSDDEIATNIRSYLIAEEYGQMAGYAALHIHSPRLAELRSLIVSEEFRGRGIGRDIVVHLTEEAVELGVSEEVLVLTYLPEFFKKLGFEEISKESIPEHKIWTDCIKCIHFPTCNEISLIYRLDR